MIRNTFLVRSSTADITLALNRPLVNVVKIEIGYVQCPAITANLDDFLYVIETDVNGPLEANGSSNMNGMPGNPNRCFLTLPAPSATVTTTYAGGNYPIVKPYTQAFVLSTINLRVVNSAGEPVTFDAGGPDFGIFFIVWTTRQ